jgi:dCTP deaminase
MFWSTQRIKGKQDEIEKSHGNSLVDPFQRCRVGQGAYELSLSTDALVSPSPESFCDQFTRQLLYPSKLDRDSFDVTREAALTIPAGQFALVYTDETVNIPKNVLAFISIKAKIKLKGLVNISGFHVDPGFSGRLKFSVYNAGTKPISLTYGEPCFLLWFSEFDEEDELPYNSGHHHGGQSGLCPEDREQMLEPSQSPAALAKRLDDLQSSVTRISTIGLVVFTIVVIPLLVAFFGVVFGKDNISTIFREYPCSSFP